MKCDKCGGNIFISNMHGKKCSNCGKSYPRKRPIKWAKQGKPQKS